MREKISIEIRNNKAFIFVIVAIIIQRIFVEIIGIEYKVFPFLEGVPITDIYIVENMYLAIWYLPMFFILQYFSGEARGLFQGYNILLITRNFTRSKLMAKLEVNILVKVILIVIFQIIVFSFNDKYNENLSLSKMIYLIVLYYLMIILLIYIELLLELFVKPNLANLYINLYVVGSILLENYIVNTRFSRIINMLLIPNYSLGLRNGLIEKNTNGTIYYQGFFIILLLIILTNIVMYRKINKMDVI